ncbi:hypothetical protein KVT40_008553 [Elsinoe batatas]|uniref:Uncharacterized protein n=1 Tax=Elsinoe batatas TaxID=2601811 RepID=A0A8K0KU75_9PEZI|nr:hypothetical protein KVT40_008553 [Elsinoe batatas]
MARAASPDLGDERSPEGSQDEFTHTKQLKNLQKQMKEKKDMKREQVAEQYVKQVVQTREKISQLDDGEFTNARNQQKHKARLEKLHELVEQKAELEKLIRIEHSSLRNIHREAAEALRIALQQRLSNVR